MWALRRRLGYDVVVDDSGARDGRGQDCVFNQCRYRRVANTRHAANNCNDGHHAKPHTAVVRALELELDLARIPHVHETSSIFMHNEDEVARRKRIEIVIPPNAVRGAPPPVPVPRDDAFLGLDPRNQLDVLTDSTKELAIDVTISSAVTDMSLGMRGHPLSSAVVPGVAAVRAAFAKREYLPYLREENTSLRVFAIETLGYGTKPAMHILARIAEHKTGSVLEHGQMYRCALRRIWQRVSVALHLAVSYRVLRYIAVYRERGDVGGDGGGDGDVEVEVGGGDVVG
jgi:hypothetical protein